MTETVYGRRPYSLFHQFDRWRLFIKSKNHVAARQLLFISLDFTSFLYFFSYYWLSVFIVTSIVTSMARNGLFCADVPLRNYSVETTALL